MKGILNENNENKQNRGQNIQELRRNDLFLRCVYDAAGRLCYKFERAADVVTEYGYTFDAAGHLTKVTRNGAICEEYRYNRAGQRMAQRRESRQGMPLDAEILRYDAQGRLTAAGDVGFDYDGQGALTGRYTRWGVTAFSYGQDTHQGIRLNIAVLPTKAQIRYEYDGIHPVRHYRYLTLTGEYVWQGDRLAAYYNHDLHLKYAFRYADTGTPSGAVLDTVTLRPLPQWRWQKFPKDTDWAKECADWLYGMSAESRRQRLWGWLESWHQVSVSNPLTLYAGCDQVGTLRVLTDKFGRVVKAVRRDSFGVLLEDSFADLFMPLGFSGGLEDADTGLVRFGWRDYDPTIGRFTAPDPARDRRGDGDIYDYCVDDPVSRVDPTGQAFSQAAAVAGGKSHAGVSHPFGGPHGQSTSSSGGKGGEDTGNEHQPDALAGGRLVAAAARVDTATDAGDTKETNTATPQTDYKKEILSLQKGCTVDKMPVEEKTARFLTREALFQPYAEKLNVDVNFLLALSAYESGWMDDHNTGLNNLFGVTKAGGRNLQYESLEAALDSWVRNFGERVHGSKNMNEFIDSLRKNGHAPYNSVNTKYDETLFRQYTSVLKWKKK